MMQTSDELVKSYAKSDAHEKSDALLKSDALVKWYAKSDA